MGLIGTYLLLNFPWRPDAASWTSGPTSGTRRLEPEPELRVVLTGVIPWPRKVTMNTERPAIRIKLRPDLSGSKSVNYVLDLAAAGMNLHTSCELHLNRTYRDSREAAAT